MLAPDVTTKRCTLCGETKPLDQFGRDAKAPDGKAWWCSSCRRAKAQAWRDANPEKKREQNRNRDRSRYLDKVRIWQRAWQRSERGKRSYRQTYLKAKYGLTIEEFQSMVAAQNGRCAICGCDDRQLVIDHNHSSGAVRGLLCNLCNQGLGALQDSEPVLKAALLYLQRHGP